MYHFFGPVQTASGIAANQGNNYTADDMVAGNILFKAGVAFSGVWCFNAAASAEADICEIVGTAGKISFSVFSSNTVTLVANDKTSILSFDPLQHVQQPMIEAVVKYFLDEGPNPCSGHEGAEVMRLIESFVG